MGWQDAPEVTGAPKWAAAPEVSPPTAPKPQPSQLEAGVSGGLQGASLGFGDEMRAAGVAGIKKALPLSLGGSSAPVGQLYTQERDKARAENATAQQAYPKTYGGAEFAGGFLPQAAATAATGGAAALPMALALGGTAGAGYSNANTLGGLARDTGIGAGVGAAGYGAGQAVGKGFSALGGLARSGARQAEARAAGKAADEIAKQIESARGSLGGEVQKGNRIIENIRRLAPQLSPQEQQIASDLEQRLSASTLQALPGQAGTIATKDAELAALRSGASQALKDRTAELLSPAEVKRQTLTRALRYGPPLLGSFIGSKIGGPMGGAVGALAGAGTRPAIQSMKRLAKNPAVQKAVLDAAESGAMGTGQFLKRAIQAATLGPAEQALAQ